MSGRVLDRTAPIADAKVFAYEVASGGMVEVETSERGDFLFERLPAGMYKLVAFKAGFLPTVELLLRRRSEDRQVVEIRLESEQTAKPASAEGYWSVRGRVPTDVLRQIDDTTATFDLATQGLYLEAQSAFSAEMRALSGIESFGSGIGEGQLMGADFDVDGRIGRVAMGLDGTFRELVNSGNGLTGEVREVAFELRPAEHQQVRLATQRSEIFGGSSPVDLQRYQVDWSGRTGETGETRVSATYTQESNYHAVSPIAPIAIPGSSETWGLAGAYSGQLSEHTDLEAGLTYRQREIGVGTGGGVAGAQWLDESLGLFTIAKSQVVPKVLVEYGLYSSMRGEGDVSLMPHGGVVVQLGDWQGRASAARRVADSQGDLFEGPRAFRTAFYSDRESCRQAGEACYEVTLSRGEADDRISVGAIHREFAETLQLYFSPDFFDRLESVFVVQDDKLSELQLSIVRRLTPRILARLESNLASGGGGIFYAADDSSYENEVRYLVTSLDTQFQSTSTGVFVAFHHLEQAFNPIETAQDSPIKLEMQRLQLMLTQDLNVLADLTSKWAVRLNMELSRGATPYALTADGELHKKLTTGLSVSF
ncbi:MAG: carboxypeptidase-like regulatory domain-containing protein [Acidobacteriota bacterium]